MFRSIPSKANPIQRQSPFKETIRQDGLVVAFHTSDSLYRDEAKRMRASAERLKLAVAIEEVPPQNWLQIVRSKVQFLISQRRDRRGPLLYVDVDAVFHSDPWQQLAVLGADVSFAVLLDGKARSGTMYLADTLGASTFLQDWQQRLHASPEAWDQHPLTGIAREAADGTSLGYSWHNLPPGLCYIFDRAEKTAGTGVVPVIEHLQASREMRDPTSVHCARRRERIRDIDNALLAGKELSGLKP